MKILLVLGIFVIQLTFGQSIQLAIQKGHSAEIDFVVFNRAGSLLASSGRDNLVKLWHVRTGKEMATIPNELKSKVLDMSFSSADDSLSIDFENGNKQVWDIGTVQKIYQGRSSTINLQKQSRYATKGFEVFIDRFYLNKRDKASGKKLFSKVPPDISKNFTALAVSEQNDRVIGANEDGTVYVYSLASGKSIQTLSEHLSSVNSVCFTADEKLFATASADRTIIIWDSKTLKKVRRLYGKSFRAEAINFDDTGNFLAVGYELGYARIIDLLSTTVNVSTFELHRQPIRDILFTHSGDRLISAAADNRIVIFDIEKKQIVDRMKYRNYVSTGDGLLKWLGSYREPYAWVNHLGVSKGDRYLLAGGAWRESEIRNQPQILFLKDLHSGRIRKFKANRGDINGIEFTGPSSWYTSDKRNVYEWVLNPLDTKVYFRHSLLSESVQLTSASLQSRDTVIASSGNAIFGVDLKSMKNFPLYDEAQPVERISIDRAGKVIAYASGTDLYLKNIRDGKSITIKNAHTDKITGIKFSPTQSLLATCSWDATVKLWNPSTGKLIVTIVSIGKTEHIMITPDNYYFGTRKALEGIGFKKGKQFISPEQFDLKYNRPDIVLAQLGNVPERVIKAYRRAYLKRLQKMNFTEAMLSEDVALPSVQIVTQNIPLQTETDVLEFDVTASDPKFLVDRFNVSINEVPVFGTNGLSVRDQNLKSIAKQLQLKLSVGKNKIQVSCLNEKGTESLAETFYVECTGVKTRPNLYLVVVAVSNYLDAKMNLKYSRKDGTNVSQLFSLKKGFYNNIFIDTLFDQNATRNRVIDLKAKLLKSSVDDQVIVFVAGHGILDSNLDFYFATYDTNFSHPGENGLKYDDLEELLNGIPARKKLLLIDACHAGEVDKTTLQASQQATLQGNQRGTLTTYTYPVDAAEEHHSIGTKTSFELMQELFGNVSKGSGAVVISASAGNSYALESDEWKNGVFTYSLLSGLKNYFADGNKDKSITATELKDFVSKEVERLTKGAQKPTSRHESLEFDFRIW